MSAFHRFWTLQRQRPLSSQSGHWRSPAHRLVESMVRLTRAPHLPVVAGLLAAASLPACANRSEEPPLPEVSRSSVGYDTVAAALAALRSRPNVVFTTENGWLIATDEAAYTIWSFAPQSYPVYPAVVKRQIIPEGAGSVIQMSVLCEASKPACDNLVRTFAEMNGLPLRQ